MCHSSLRAGDVWYVNCSVQGDAALCHAARSQARCVPPQTRRRKAPGAVLGPWHASLPCSSGCACARGCWLPRPPPDAPTPGVGVGGYGYPCRSPGAPASSFTRALARAGPQLPTPLPPPMPLPSPLPLPLPPPPPQTLLQQITGTRVKL